MALNDMNRFNEFPNQTSRPMIQQNYNPLPPPKMIHVVPVVKRENRCDERCQRCECLCTICCCICDIMSMCWIGRSSAVLDKRFWLFDYIFYLMNLILIFSLVKDIQINLLLDFIYSYLKFEFEYFKTVWANSKLLTKSWVNIKD